MNIRKDILASSDVQNFPVSTSNIFVPFVWSVPPSIYSRFFKSADNKQIDIKNGIILCLPKNIFDMLDSKGLIDYKPNIILINDVENPQSKKEIEAAIYRENTLLEHLASVQIENMSEFSPGEGRESIIDSFKRIKYYVRVDSIRVSPYIGRLIASSRESYIERIAVPRENGVSINGESNAIAIPPDATSSNEIDNLRESLYEDINNAMNSDRIIDQNINGPYVPDVNKSVSYHCNNQIVLDQNKKELSVYTNIEEAPKITYNGVGDIYRSKANSRIYGTPVAFYDTNEAENPGQSYQHSTFMTPTPGLISSPLGSLTSNNQEIPALFKEFAGLLG